jgi:hypothetical protein
MAALDENGGVTTHDPKLDAYAAALDRLQRKCQEERRQLGDMSQTAHEALDKKVVGTQCHPRCTSVAWALPVPAWSRPDRRCGHRHAPRALVLQPRLLDRRSIRLVWKSGGSLPNWPWPTR